MKGYKLNGGSDLDSIFAVGETDSRQCLGYYHYFRRPRHYFYEDGNVLACDDDRDKLLNDKPTKDNVKILGHVFTPTSLKYYLGVNKRYYFDKASFDNSFYKSKRLGKWGTCFCRFEINSNLKKE